MTPEERYRDVEMHIEAYVRSVRDKVFGHSSSDANWESTKKNWMKRENINWLAEKEAIPLPQFFD